MSSYTFIMSKLGESTNLVLNEYQMGTLEILSENNNTFLGSRFIWETLNDKGISVSRASVINFLKLLRMSGYLRSNDATGKGGVRALYKLKYDLKTTYLLIAYDLMKAIGQSLVFGDESWEKLLTMLER